MLKYFDMDIHELFTNNSELLNELVRESEKVNIELKLHPSLILKSAEPLSEKDTPLQNGGQKELEATSPIQTPPPFFTEDTTPPNLEIDLEGDNPLPKV